MKFIFAFIVCCVLIIPATKSHAAADSSRVPVAVVHAEGKVGESYTQEAFRRAFDSAKNENAQCMLIILDSAGGTIHDARLIAKTIQAKKGSMRVVVVVKEALGPAVWLLAASDQILFSAAGSSGAAVAFETNKPADDDTRDKHDYAALAAEVAAIAQANGQPGEIYRAMIDPSQSLWTTMDANGSLNYENSFLHDGNAKEWDGPTTVLALTPAEAQSIGFGGPAQSSEDAIFNALGYTSRDEARSPFRSFAVASRKFVRDRSQYDRMLEQARETYTELYGEVKNFNELDRDWKFLKPSSFAQTGKHSGRYRQVFLDEVEDYRSALEKVSRSIQKVAALEKKLNATVGRTNEFVRKLNEHHGYKRMGELDWSLDKETKSKLESEWRTIQDELAWCRDQE